MAVNETVSAAATGIGDPMGLIMIVGIILFIGYIAYAMMNIFST